MSSVSLLTTRQKEEVDQGILAFLSKHGLKDVASCMQEEVKVDLDQKMGGILERKWRTIAKLESRIEDLELANVEMQDTLDKYKAGGKVDTSETLPKKELHSMEGHREPITSVCFHPQWAMVATSSQDKTIKLWDTDNGRYKRTLEGHAESVEEVTFSFSGHLLASASADLTIRFWDPNDDFKCVKVLKGHEHTVSSLCFSADGTTLYSGSRDATAKQWDVASGKLKHSFEGQDGHDKWVRCVRLSPDGTTLATCSHDHTIKLWELKTNTCSWTLRDHEHVVESLCFTSAKAEDALMEGVLEDQDAKLTRANKAKLEGKDDIGGMFLISGSRDRTIRIWMVSEGVCVKTLKGHENWVKSVIMHPSGRFIVSCSDDCSIRCWDLRKGGRCARKINKAHKNFITSLDWNRSFPMMVSGARDNKVKLWLCV